MARRASSGNVIKLTKGVVASLAVEIGQSERVVWDAEMPRFGVRIRASGNKSWVIRPARSGGKSRLHTIGSVDTLDISTSRQPAKRRARSLRKLTWVAIRPERSARRELVLL